MATEKTQVIQDQNQQELMNKVSEIQEVFGKYVEYPCFSDNGLCMEIPFGDIDVIPSVRECLVIWLKEGGGLCIDYANMQLMMTKDNTKWRGVEIKDFFIQIMESGVYIELKL